MAMLFFGTQNMFSQNIRLEKLNNKYANQIYKKTKSEIATRHFEEEARKFNNVKELKKYYFKVNNDLPKNISELYKEKSGYILPEDMKTVSQKALDSSFTLEEELNRYVESGYDAAKSIVLMDKIGKNYKKNSSDNYLEEIENVKIVEEVMSQLFYIKGADDIDVFGIEDFTASFRIVHHNKIDDCEGATIYAAGALSDNGFPAYELVLYGERKMGRKTKKILHSLFIYKTDEGNFGTLGKREGNILYPRYNSIKKLVNKINERIKIKYKEYQIFDIEKQFPDFIDNNKDNNSMNMYSEWRKINQD